MTEHPFATLIRKLDAEASKAPWALFSHEGAVLDFGGMAAIRADGDVIVKANGGAVSSKVFPGGPANARAIVTLRNAAPEVAALVEAAETCRSLFTAPWRSSPDMYRDRDDAMEKVYAALDALARAARDATSGPADPTRIEGSPK